jgi:hypothetical protein
MQLRAGQTADIFADYANKPATTGTMSFVGPSVNLKPGAAPVPSGWRQRIGRRR